MQDISTYLQQEVEAHRKAMDLFIRHTRHDFITVADKLLSAIRAGNKIMLCGNGGSAADAQHIAAELSGRFRKKRGGLPAIALTTNTSALTAIGNDYDFEYIFARQIEAISKPGDVLIAISTSGQSPNMMRAVEVARGNGCLTLCLSGGPGNPLSMFSHHAIMVPSEDTARIQEMHILVGHILCGWIEENL